MKNHPKMAMGILLIGIGAVLLSVNLFPTFDSDILWPLYLLIPVFFMISSLINGNKSLKDIIIPVTTLLYLIIFFIWLNINGWHTLKTLWPLFLFAPASGLIALFIVTFDTGLLVPIALLIGIGFIFLFGFANKRFLFASFIILVGIAMLFDSIIKTARKDHSSGHHTKTKHDESSDYADFD